MDQKLKRVKTKKLVIKKIVGVFWPAWKLLQDFKDRKFKPVIRKKMVVGGESGAMEPWGILTHCSAVEEWDEGGITDVKDVAKASQLEDAGDGFPVYKHGKICARPYFCWKIGHCL